MLNNSAGAACLPACTSTRKNYKMQAHTSCRVCCNARGKNTRGIHAHACTQKCTYEDIPDRRHQARGLHIIRATAARGARTHQRVPDGFTKTCFCFRWVHQRKQKTQSKKTSKKQAAEQLCTSLVNISLAAAKTQLFTPVGHKTNVPVVVVSV